jgi:hypothetical protein
LSGNTLPPKLRTTIRIIRNNAPGQARNHLEESR